MRRIVTLPLLVFVVGSLVPASLFGQAGKEPEVQATLYVFDATTGKEVSVDGIVVEESVAGVKLKSGAMTKLIPAMDIRQVTYKTKVPALTFRSAFSTEDKGLVADQRLEKRLEYLDDALRKFKDLQKEVKDVPQAERYINFKVAEVQAEIARADKTKIGDAVKALEEFRTNYGRSWQLIPTMKHLAELQELKGDLEAAGKVYEELADMPDAPADVKQTAQMLMAQMLLRAKKYKEAENRLVLARARLQPNDTQRPKITVMICQSQMLQGKLDGVEKELTAALTATQDGLLQAVGHNCLGDYFLAKKQDEAAFWEYLKVHLMYTQDRTEHARAVYRLSKLFDSVQKDPIRAEEMRAQLLSDKDFLGTEWQEKAKAESPKPMTMP